METNSSGTWWGALLERLRGVAEVERMDSPNGDGELVFTRTAAGWGQTALAGPSSRTRRHEFHGIEGFASFLNRHALDQTGTDILVGVEEAVAYFAPTGATSSRVTLGLPLAPEFSAWVVASDGSGRRSHGELLRLLRLNRHTVVNAEAVLSGLQQFGVAVTRGGKVEVDELGTVRASSVEGRVDVTGSVPPVIRLHVPVFRYFPLELATVEVVVELEIDDGGGASFRLHCSGWDAAKDWARGRVAELLAELLEEEFLVGVGDALVERAAVSENADPSLVD